VKPIAGVALALAALAGARVAREAVGSRDDVVDEPYAPSPSSAPIVFLGYREVFADLLWIRLTGYFGGRQSTANGVASLAEAVVALDPKFRRVYDYSANAMTIAHEGVDQTTYLRAIALLERGIVEFPDDWKIPFLAGQIYTQDLQTTDPAQRRAWTSAARCSPNRRSASRARRSDRRRGRRSCGPSSASTIVRCRGCARCCSSPRRRSRGAR